MILLTALVVFRLSSDSQVSITNTKAEEPQGDYQVSVNFDFDTTNIPIQLDIIKDNTVIKTKNVQSITQTNEVRFNFTSNELENGFYNIKLTPNNHTSNTGYVTIIENQGTRVHVDGRFLGGKYSTIDPQNIVILDIARFLQYFKAKDNTKDITGDGRINLQDLIKLLRSFRTSMSTPYIEPNKEIIVLGDSGTGDARQTEVGEAIGNYCFDNNCKSSYIVGDVIYYSGVSSIDDPQFDTKFENPYRNVHVPFYIGYGNHDYQGCQDCYLNYQGTGKWEMPARYYSVDYGDLLVIMINTEEFNSANQTWLTNELAKSNKWKVIVGHRPIITNDVSHTGENWTGLNEFKNIACSRADVYIAGHAHLLEDMGYPEGCSMRQLISGGGGIGARSYTDTYPSLFEQSTNGFVSVEVAGDRLIFHYIDYNGNEIYTSSITK